MQIRKVTLKNYRCFEDIEINFHDRLSVIVGNNGSGKTSILEGLAVSLGTMFTGLDGLSGISLNKRDAHLKTYQMGESEDVQAQYPVEIVAEGILDGKELVWKRTLNGEGGSTTVKDAKQLLDIVKDFQRRLRAGDRKLVLPVIAYYGTGRLWDYHKEKKSDTFKENTKTNGYIGSLDGTANFKLMMNWFLKKTLQRIQKSAIGLNSMIELTVVYGAMAKCFECITGNKDVKFLYNVDTNEIDCCYTDDGGLRMSIPLSQMSDGYKSTISLIADIAYRMAVLNPQLGTSVLDNTEGVVLIDEIDLHLHPTWQKRILKDLLEIFPKIQFIVSTHAPEVINSVKSDSIVILKDNEILPAVDETYGKDANAILREVMEVSTRPDDVKVLFERFYALLDKGEWHQAEAVINELESEIGSNDAEVNSCRVRLALEQM